MDVFSGEPLTWKNWAKNQPASLSEDQDCAVINKNRDRDLTQPDHLTIDKQIKAQAPSACELVLPFALYTHPPKWVSLENVVRKADVV